MARCIVTGKQRGIDGIEMGGFNVGEIEHIEFPLAHDDGPDDKTISPSSLVKLSTG